MQAVYSAAATRTNIRALPFPATILERLPARIPAASAAAALPDSRAREPSSVVTALAKAQTVSAVSVTPQ